MNRNFSAPAPNRLWLCDITHVKTHSGIVYVAFVIDCFARMIVGWQASRNIRTDLCLDALEQAVWARKDEGLDELIHHSDRGSQYLSIRYTERLAEAGGVQSVGSKGDSYDNALAESVIGLYKTELIYNMGPWSGLDDVEFGSLEWVDWWNNRRLLEPIGMIPPAEAELLFYSQEILVEEPGLKETSLYETRRGSNGLSANCARATRWIRVSSFATTSSQAWQKGRRGSKRGFVTNIYKTCTRVITFSAHAVEGISPIASTRHSPPEGSPCC